LGGPPAKHDSMDFDFAGGSFFYVPQGTDGSASKTGVVMKRDATHSRGQGLVEFALVVPVAVRR